MQMFIAVINKLVGDVHLTGAAESGKTMPLPFADDGRRFTNPRI